MTGTYDLAIVGGGLAGGLLALALAPLPFKIVLLEAKSLQAKISANTDGRSLALSYSSVQVLKATGLWSKLLSYATAIEEVHVSSRGGIGISRLHPKEVDLPALGYVVAIDDLQREIATLLSKQGRLTFRAPALVQNLTQNEQDVILHLQDQEAVRAKLVLAADGTESSIRKLLNIATHKTDYQQTAILANIGLQRSHHNIAYERFTKDGPLAALPLAGKNVAMVWTMTPQLAEQRIAMPETAFLQDLQSAFGYRLGRFERVGQRHSYQLQLIHAATQHKDRVLLFGNAAHSLHPVAGQGFNLTVRDIALLAETFLNAEVLSANVLQSYVDARLVQQQQMIKMTDGLIRLFNQEFWPINMVRDLSLRQFERLPPLKNWFNRLMSGQAGTLPRLARGLNLVDD